MLFSILSVLLFTAYIGLIIFYRFGWAALKDFSQHKIEPAAYPFISVIICARNESENIESCLRSVAGQSIGSDAFEIILIDDHSKDDTVSKARALGILNLKVIHLEIFDTAFLNSFKKFGITQGISAAKGPLIVTTDADCTVAARWLRDIRSFYLKKKVAFIAAPVVFETKLRLPFMNRLLVVFQQLDFMVLQGITGASVRANFHNMCNGANLAYMKSAFETVEGFQGIDDIASGDDMLLMSKIEKAYPGKIGYLKSKSAIVRAEPARTLKEFINQRIRWASKAGRYSDFRITSVLLLVYIFNLWIFMTLILGFFSAVSFYMFLVLVTGKTLVELFFLFPVARFFGKQHLLWWFIPAQPFHILYTIIAGALGKFGTYNWKGRQIN